MLTPEFLNRKIMANTTQQMWQQQLQPHQYNNNIKYATTTSSMQQQPQVSKCRLQQFQVWNNNIKNANVVYNNWLDDNNDDNLNCTT